MDLKTYFINLPIPDRVRMAEACETTLGHLRNVAYGKLCGEDLAMNIEMFSAGAVTCEELRPDLADQWAYLRNSRPQQPHQEAA